MSVIAKKTLKDFWEKHLDCEQQLKAWYQEAEDAKWKGPNEIKKAIPVPLSWRIIGWYSTLRAIITG